MTKKRRQFSPEFKTQVVLELLTGEKGLMEASREYEIKDSVLSRWKQQFLKSSVDAFKTQQGNQQGQEEQIAELERMIGQLTMELEIAKKALGYSVSSKYKSGKW
jgi:transposase